MSWIFGTIDFDTYGVKVSRTYGVLDLPKLQTEGYNWLDEDGLDYWQDSHQYNDREIILNCWMYAEAGGGSTGYANFKTKVDTFTAAIKAAGKVTLQTPYISISDCSICKGVTIIRETNYVNDLQAGTFTLRITVHGDSKYSLLSILWSGGSSVVDVVKTNNLVVNKSLQGDMYATCTAETNAPIAATAYDYININSNGTDNEKYYLVGEPEYKKLSTNKYTYNLRFEHGSALLKDSQFIMNGESDFYYYANLEEIVDLIVSNSNRVISGKFQKGTIVSTLRRNHKFSGENCYDVLKRIAAEYDMEYQFQLVSGAVYYLINVDEQIATTKAVSLEYGKGNGLYEISRGAVDRDKLCTRLYAYGAAKNLKPDYVYQRLVCPGNPLENNIFVYGSHEKTVYFDEIYPQRTATITAYLQKLPDDPTLTEAEKQVWPGGIYRITDSTIDFDINDYLLGGLTAKIRMKTGNLAGMEFEIEKYDHDYQHIWIIPFKDERGESFPNATLMFAAGDEYTLVDIDQPAAYVSTAESELLAAAQDYIANWSVPKYSYNVRIDPAFILANPGGFDVGDKVTVIDSDFSINGLFRISSMQYNVHTAVYDLVLAEYYTEKRLTQKLEKSASRIDALERAAEDTKKDTVESMRKEKETATELKNRLLDPVDDLQDLDRTVRDESVDPRMLAYDAGTPQFSLKNALVETNVSGDEDAVKVNAGHLVMHNYKENTLDRYAIQKLKDEAGTYDPTRTWVIEETNFTLATKNGYWLYAKINMASGSTSCVLEVYEDHKEVKLDVEDGYLKYKLGYISSASSPRYACMLWGNVKTPSLQQIQTILDDTVPNPKTGWNVDAWYNEVTAVWYDASRQLYLTPIDSSFEYFIQGTRYEKTSAVSVQIDDTTGMHYIVFNGENLVSSMTPWDIRADDRCLVAAIYWNATLGKAVVVGGEPHTYTLPAPTHYWQHHTIGTRYGGGLVVSINATDDWKIDVTEGSIIDEDILIQITDGASGIYAQELTALQAKKVYRSGTDWTYENTVPTNIVSLDGSNDVYKNELIAGSWTRTPINVNQYTAVWLVATNDIDDPLIWVLGQGDDGNLNTAKSGNQLADMNFSGLPTAEFRVLARIIVKNITASPYYEIADIEQVQNDDIIPGGDVTNDSYVIGASWDAPTQTLTLSRNNGLADIDVNIPYTGEENVQSDWDQVDNTADDFIKNKPTIPAAQIQSDWNQADSGEVDYIKNKPTIPEDNYVDGFSASAQSSGTLPTVSNTNNVIKLTIERTGALSDLTAELGSMAGFKFWYGTQDDYDALGSWNDDTLYHILEE